MIAAEIFQAEWATLDHLMVAAYCALMADPDTDEIVSPAEHMNVCDMIAMSCDLGWRRTLTIMGNLRERGLLRYDTGGKYGVRPADCRVFLNRSWVG